MGLLAPLAALLGLEAEKLADRARNAAILYGLIAVSLLVAIVFGLIAAYLALSQSVGPIIAALAFCGGFLALALVFYLGMLVGRGRRQRALAEKRRSSETGAFITTAALTALPVVLKSPAFVKFGLPAAAVALYALFRDTGDKD